MDWFIERLHHKNPTLDYQDLCNHREDFKKLSDLKIIKHKETLETIPCNLCDEDHAVSPFFNKKEEIIISCSGSSRIVNQDEMKIWEIDIPHFLLLFQKILGITLPKVNTNIEGLLWDLGTQKLNGVSYHLFFSQNINEIEKPKLSIITNLPHSVVFYTNTPQVSLPNKILLVPIIDLIKKITNKGILLDKELFEQFFPKNVYATKEGAIELDDDFVLQDNHLLFEPLRGGVFKKQSTKLRPLATRIIDHLYGICTYQDNAKTLDELASALGSSKVSISNEIGRIEKASNDNNLKAILYKYAGDKWGINPQLKCCK